MKPLKVALIVKNKPAPKKREDRNMGYWSYEVPQFEWEHFSPGTPFTRDARDFKDFDLIFHEDGGNWGKWTNTSGGPPIVYMVIDSTLTSDHYRARHAQAKQAALVLVDHDRLERFADCGPPVRRFCYCVNDRVFRPYSWNKTQDLNFHCTTGGNHVGSDARRQVRRFLDRVAREYNYTYRSGGIALEDYARSLNASKVTVNLPRTTANRPHRILDAMAAWSCVLTAPFGHVPEDGIYDNEHFKRFRELEDLDDAVVDLIESGAWREFADAGHKHVMARHTWATRAEELREMLKCELSL
jgi:glycosyltransferase involved in cell wall biosynthesis